MRNAAKPDSEDICFVPDGDYARCCCVVPKVRAQGAIVHAATGETLGQHKGVIHYTVGQRRGRRSGEAALNRYTMWAIDADAAQVSGV